MSGAALRPVLRHVRQLAAIAEAGERTDRQLLADFATGHDEAAFSALVRRHGALVLGVCRQVLRHAEDAEDVFQATFLVLARKAGSIRSGEALAGWLHGVAYRLARNAKRSATRRRGYERGAQPMSPRDPSWEGGWQEAQALVVEEVERLPPKYRLPFLLCHVEGQSRADAARQLGLKEATVRSRLARACKRLQECLARRGVTLVAVLAMGALGEGKGLALVPARLASTTVRAALHYAGLRTAATAAASAQVVALANGLLRGLALAKLKSASVVLVALGILAAGAGTAAQWLVPGQHAGHVASGHVEELGLASRAAASAVHPAPAADAVHVRGQVLDPDGQPHAGASIYLWTSAVAKNADLPVRATTGADGRFRLLVTARERAQGATVVARAPGHGPDWFEVPHSVKDPKVTFRLTKDDVPITGRIIDPEGRPIPGVTVEVRGLGHQADCGDLAAWVNRKVKEESQGCYLPEEGLDTVGVEAVNLPAAVTTGADGRFQLTGFGREKVVTFDVHGTAIEHARLRALTKPGPGQGWIPGRGGLYAATFDFVAGPPKPIAGTVCDKATGQPLAGITVGALMNGRGAITTTTDAQGRYRLDAGKHSEYWVVAEGLAYFQAIKRAADTPGFEPLAVDFSLERGLPITGRLTDKATGQPVRGWVWYYPLPTNPHRKDFRAAFGPGRVIMTQWGVTAVDGSFTTLGIPGPGVLVAGADFENRYAMVDKRAELDALGIRANHPIRLVHAVVRVDCAADNPASRACDIAFDSGGTVTGSVAGPEGEPLEGAVVAGLVISSPRRLPADTFTFTGLGPTAKRILVFLHPEKKLGKMQAVRGDDRGPLTVRLEQLGGLAGRVIDGAGHPWAGLQLTAFPSLMGAYYENLPLEKFGFQGEEGYRLSLWYRLTRRQTTTGADGHFQLDGLVPGWPYQVFVSDGDLEEADTLLWARDGLVAGAARTMDLGDLQAETAGMGERADLLIPGKGPEGEEGRPGKRFWQIRWLYQPSELNPDTAASSDTEPRTGGVMR